MAESTFQFNAADGSKRSCKELWATDSKVSWLSRSGSYASLRILATSDKAELPEGKKNVETTYIKACPAVGGRYPHSSKCSRNVSNAISPWPTVLRIIPSFLAATEQQDWGRSCTLNAFSQAFLEKHFTWDLLPTHRSLWKEQEFILSVINIQCVHSYSRGLKGQRMAPHLRFISDPSMLLLSEKHTLTDPKWQSQDGNKIEPKMFQ